MQTRTGLKLLIALLLSFCISNTAIADERDQLINDIFTLAGISATLEQLPTLLSATFDSLLAQKPDDKETITQLKNIMTNGMAPQTMQNSAHDYLRQQFDDKELSYIQQQLSSPLAKKMTALETSVNEPDSRDKIIAYAQSLEQNPPSEARINLIAELVSASNALEASLALRTEFFRGFIGATTLLDPVDKRSSQQQIDSQIDSLREKMHEPIAQEIILTFFYMYRSLPDAELSDYIALYQQPQMARFNVELNNAIAQAFRASGKVIMEALAVSLAAS